MMTTIKIKFWSDGRWGDHPSDPIFEVTAGEEREVSPLLANFAVDSGKAEFVREKRKPGPKAAPKHGCHISDLRHIPIPDILIEW